MQKGNPAKAAHLRARHETLFTVIEVDPHDGDQTRVDGATTRQGALSKRHRFLQENQFVDPKNVIIGEPLSNLPANKDGLPHR